ncbi:MAG TPA: thioredoxin family protein [Gemmataceae bacterium]|jgi:peroxiredoxin/mono/diheme cytochrome c family protein
MRHILSLGTALFLIPLVCAADPKPADKAPRQAPAFTLKDASGKDWSLEDQQKKKAVVVVFIGTECPVNNAYIPRLAELHKEYAPRGVAFVAINANSQDTPVRVAAHAKEQGIPFPVLKDTANIVADQFDAHRTPEAFVLDGSRKVRYQGRIDDQFGIGFKRPAPTRRDLAEALDAVLDDKPVSQPLTQASGCPISRTIKPKAEGTVTYTKHVAPILQANCQECHRPGQVAPMSLLSYKDALGWAEAIREVIEEKRMPPWYADPEYGHFSNDRSLSKEDRDTLLTWIKQSCPKGDERDLPPARRFSTDWTIGKPDVVFSMSKEFNIPAKGGKNGIRYQYFAVQTNFEEDRWIQAAEARPGNRAVVHHILVYIREPGKERQRIRPDGIGDGLLVAYAPGELPAVFAPGTAKKVPKGATLLFQLHYTPNGIEQKDRSSVGLIFAKQTPKYEVFTRAVAQQRFAIPPGDDNHEVKSATVFSDDVRLMSLMPHMHLRGKDFEYRVTYPDGKSDILLRVPRYDFNWQSHYRLTKPLDLPPGTRLECTAHFDNSADNFNNPDARQRVFWGEQTWEEMMIGFVDYVKVNERR